MLGIPATFSAWSYGKAINSTGQVVGAMAGNGNYHGFLWTQSSGVQDLNDLLPANSGWVITDASGINNRGEIVGLGTHNGTPAVYMMTPPMASIAVTNLSEQHQQYPSTAWVPLTGSTTTDGNLIQVTATVQNLTSVNQTAVIALRDTESGNALLGTFVSPTCTMPCSVIFSPNEVRNVIFQWDTSGGAWNDDGTKHPTPRQIAVTLNGISYPAGSITVNPKPVILVHGLNETINGEWGNYTDPTNGFLVQAHPNWKGFSVTGMNVSSSPLGKHISENAQALATFIDDPSSGIRKSQNAWHVDLVGHSMGGLISRYYIANLMPASTDSRPVVHRLVMLGTPNEGSPCAAVGSGGYFVAWSVLSYLFKTPLGLPIAFPLWENTPNYVVNTFDAQVTNKKGVEFDNLAGTGQLTGAYGILSHACFLSGPNDGAVTVQSAQAYHDYTATSVRNHFQENGYEDFTSFVKPRLAVGPSAAASGQVARSTSSPVKQVITTMDASSPGPQIINSSAVAVPAGGTLDVPLSVTSGTALGVTLIIPATTDAALFDPSGSTVVSLPVGNARSGDLLQGLAVANPAIGQWHLHLVNNDTEGVS